MTDEYTKSKTRVVGEGYDEDNWNNTNDNTPNGANSVCPKNDEYPDGDPFVTFGDHAGSPMKWWINYHWTSQSGTYANDWFNSNFDPKQFFQLSGNELTLRAFDPNDPHDPKISCIASELVSEALAQGTYTFLVTARVDQGGISPSFAFLDPNVIFGIFTYQWGGADPNDTPNIHRELDLLETVNAEWAQVDVPGSNAQFTVQPWNANSSPPNYPNLERLTIPDTRYLTAVMFHNLQGLLGVTYQLFAGNYSLDDLAKKENPPAPFATWQVPTDYIPPDGGCPRFHINLYLAKGTPPQKEQRITITRIQLE
jgi:hypothetical protein